MLIFHFRNQPCITLSVSSLNSVRNIAITQWNDELSEDDYSYDELVSNECGEGLLDDFWESTNLADD
jgi:hypothetical protein